MTEEDQTQRKDSQDATRGVENTQTTVGKRLVSETHAPSNAESQRTRIEDDMTQYKTAPGIGDNITTRIMSEASSSQEEQSQFDVAMDTSVTIETVDCRTKTTGINDNKESDLEADMKEEGSEVGGVTEDAGGTGIM